MLQCSPIKGKRLIGMLNGYRELKKFSTAQLFRNQKPIQCINPNQKRMKSLNANSPFSERNLSSYLLLFSVRTIGTFSPCALCRCLLGK